MHWSEMDKKLVSLYNAVAEAHTGSARVSERSESKAIKIMEELTIDLIELQVFRKLKNSDNTD